MPERPFFVTGIGTGIGKTIVSAILVQKLKADYWKPIQSGELENSDTMKVQSLVTNSLSVYHPEAYRLSQPYSPHKSADIDGINIEPEQVKLPETDRQLIIEGAGGLMVPLNAGYLMIDLIKQLDAEVILVSQNYLGSINHTLLSIQVLKQYQVPVRGVIFNGVKDPYSEGFILNYTGITLLGRVPEFARPDKSAIVKAGSHITL
jgi:dethiobiotin synthetase